MTHFQHLSATGFAATIRVSPAAKPRFSSVLFICLQVAVATMWGLELNLEMLSGDHPAVVKSRVVVVAGGLVAVIDQH